MPVWYAWLYYCEHMCIDKLNSIQLQAWIAVGIIHHVKTGKKTRIEKSDEFLVFDKERNEPLIKCKNTHFVVPWRKP